MLLVPLMNTARMVARDLGGSFSHCNTLTFTYELSGEMKAAEKSFYYFHCHLNLSVNKDLCMCQNGRIVLNGMREFILSSLQQGLGEFNFNQCMQIVTLGLVVGLFQIFCFLGFL